MFKPNDPFEKWYNKNLGWKSVKQYSLDELKRAYYDGYNYGCNHGFLSGMLLMLLFCAAAFFLIN